ncbi:MAG: butyrate kinase [Synergistaceae bacterium]|nr:butyrate kinase [Synergistaceae bacterium]
MKVLALNPGSTSTKVALFEDGTELWSETQRYDTDVIGKFASIPDQEGFRLDEIRKCLEAHGTALADLDAVVGRGGLLRPIESGTYEVNDKMLSDVRSCKWGAHASNLGAPLAVRLAAEGGCRKAFIVDPVVVDELGPLARYSGLPEIERRSIFHALNQKSVGRRAASDLGKPYEQCNFIVAHMGGGISVGAHDHGRVTDVNNALDGDGPFSPERAGSLPAGGLVRLAFSGRYDQPTLLKMITGRGGLVAHLGTNDLREVRKRMAEGDEKAKLLFEALAYQVSKEIGACAAVLEGKVDAVILTGGLAYSEEFTGLISGRVSFIAPVMIYPGEDEMQALADGAFRVLKGTETARQYD